MQVNRVASGVWRVGTRYVNAYIVDGGSGGLTLVDTGLPAYAGAIEDAIRATFGRPADVTAVLLTHGHIDHVGSAHRFAGGAAPVFLHRDDREVAADPRRNRTERSLGPYLLWPATLAFVAHCLANGALAPRPVPEFSSLTDGDTLDVPGSPKVFHVPGHTAGSCVFEFPEHGVAMVGDALCTVSPVSGRRVGPQLQTRGSSLDCELALASLERLEQRLGSRVLLPGHGRPWRDGIEAAVRSARRTGCR